jgi:hypothetical protein
MGLGWHQADARAMLGNLWVTTNTVNEGATALDLYTDILLPATSIYATNLSLANAYLAPVMKTEPAIMTAAEKAIPRE